MLVGSCCRLHHGFDCLYDVWQLYLSRRSEIHEVDIDLGIFEVWKGVMVLFLGRFGKFRRPNQSKRSSGIIIRGTIAEGGLE